MIVRYAHSGFGQKLLSVVFTRGSLRTGVRSSCRLSPGEDSGSGSGQRWGWFSFGKKMEKGEGGWGGVGTGKETGKSMCTVFVKTTL